MKTYDLNQHGPSFSHMSLKKLLFSKNILTNAIRNNSFETFKKKEKDTWLQMSKDAHFVKINCKGTLLFL